MDEEEFGEDEIKDVQTVPSWALNVPWCGAEFTLEAIEGLLLFIQGNLTARRNIDEVLCSGVVPYTRQHNSTFQQDNTRLHVVRYTQVFLIQ